MTSYQECHHPVQYKHTHAYTHTKHINAHRSSNATCTKSSAAFDNVRPYVAVRQNASRWVVCVKGVIRSVIDLTQPFKLYGVT